MSYYYNWTFCTSRYDFSAVKQDTSTTTLAKRRTIYLCLFSKILPILMSCRAKRQWYSLIKSYIKIWRNGKWMWTWMRNIYIEDKNLISVLPDLSVHAPRSLMTFGWSTSLRRLYSVRRSCANKKTIKTCKLSVFIPDSFHYKSILLTWSS